MMVFKNGSGSLHPRVPSAGFALGFPNVTARRNATKTESPIRIENRVPVANRLLAALPRKECQHMIDELEQVALTYGEVLYAPGGADKARLLSQ